MSAPDCFSRREALKVLGTGAACLALGSVKGLSAEAPPAQTGLFAPPAKSAPPPQPFTLPELSYGFEAMEPVIDVRTMEIHYNKHHQSYIDQANRALAEFPEYQRKTAKELLKGIRSLPEKLQTPVRNFVGGHVNHSHYWQILAPRPTRGPSAAFMEPLERQFGSLEAFKLRFVDSGMKRFGSGWVWLCVARDKSLVLYSTANQDSPLSEGLTPILGLDVWEHAYYLNYQSSRQGYIEAVWQRINWPQVEHFYQEALVPPVVTPPPAANPIPAKA